MSYVEAAICVWFSQGFSLKAFRFDDTFAHAKKRMLKGPVLGKGVSTNTKRETGKDTHTRTHRSLYFRPSEDFIHHSHVLTLTQIFTVTRGSHSRALLYRISVCEVPSDSVCHFDDPMF